jgi:hypothetical protein
MVSRIASAAGLLATLALLSACGGSSSSTTTNKTATFKSGYEKARNDLQKTSDEIGTAITNATNQTDAQIASTFKALASTWQGELSQLQTLKPPADLAADFNSLTGAVSRVETDLNSVVSAADTHSSSAAEQAGANIVTDITEAKAADTTLKKKLGIS